MKKNLIVLILVLIFTLALATPAFAHGAGPCGGGTGQAYAEHHVLFLAQAGMLGAGGHAPGDHQGFSICVVGP